MRRFTMLTVFGLVAALVILPMVPSYAVAAETTTASGESGPSAGAMGADLVVARPLGIAATALGLVGYVVSLPFSLPGGNQGAVWQKCVANPVVYTFMRPLGEF